jgi:hypothetical protein
MAAYYICKNCNQQHPAPLFFSNENDFTGGEIGNNTFLCPITGKTSAYEKRQMFWSKYEEQEVRRRGSSSSRVYTDRGERMFMLSR